MGRTEYCIGQPVPTVVHHHRRRPRRRLRLRNFVLFLGAIVNTAKSVSESMFDCH